MRSHHHCQLSSDNTHRSNQESTPEAFRLLLNPTTRQIVVHMFAGVTRIPVALGAIALQSATGPGWACGILQEQLQDGSLMTDFELSADRTAGSQTSISGFHAKVCFSSSTMHNAQYLCLIRLHAAGKGRHPEAIPGHPIDCGQSRVTKAASMTKPGLKMCIAQNSVVYPAWHGIKESCKFR